MTATRHVTIGKFSEISGYSEKAIYHKIEQGVWIEGRQWRKARDNRILIDIKGYESWVEGDQAPVSRR